MVDWETVRTLALALPEVEVDETSDGRPRFRIRGKAFAWMARERDGGGLAVRVDREEKHLILEASPDVYFSSPHYDGYPGVLIRLEKIEADELAERLEDAWLIQAPKRLARGFLDADT
jgi:hypothetical protein